MMNRLAHAPLLFLLALVFSPAAASAQPASRGQSPAPKATPLVVALGAKRVSIPAPHGFVEATTEFDAIKERFTKTESPLNEVLAAHVPDEVAAELRRGGEQGLTFYTKVSVLKKLRGVDVSPTDFAQFVSSFQKEGAKSLKADSPLMRERVKKLEQALGELGTGVTKFDIAQTEMLGEIESAPNVYSLLLLVRLQVTEADGQSRVVPMVGGMAAVRVRQRLIFVYTYRHFKTSADADLLSKFTRDWTAQILAANPGN